MEDLACSFPLDELNLRKVAQGLSAIFNPLETRKAESHKHEQVERILRVALDTAFTSNLSSSHRTAACNLLCGTVEKCLASSDGALTSRIAFHDFYKELHRLFYTHYYNAKEKSMRQLLTVLVKLLQRVHDSDQGSRLVNQSSDYAFDTIFKSQDRTKARPAFLSLHQYLLKGVVLPTQLLFMFNEWYENSYKVNTESSVPLILQRFLAGVLEWIKFADVAASAGQLTTSFLKALSKAHHVLRDDGLEAPIWAQPLVHCIARHPSYVQSFRTNVLPSLFKDDSEDFWLFLRYLRVNEHLGLEWSSALALRHDWKAQRLILFSALQVGMGQGLISISDNKRIRGIEFVNGVVYVKETVLCQLLQYSSQGTRLAGLTLLITSPQMTKPYSRTLLKAFGHNLAYLLEDADPFFRGEVQSLIQIFVYRLRAISVALHKTSSSQQKASPQDYGKMVPSKLLQVHKSFISELLRFLTFELHPGASYQRHISALKILTTLLKSGLDDNVQEAQLSKQAKIDPLWPFHINCVDSMLYRALVDGLMDPFEDVRQSSLECLKLAPMGLYQYYGSESFDITKVSLLAKAERTMNRSGRLDHANGVACLYSLFFYHNHFNIASHETSRAAIDFLEVVLSSTEESVNVANEDLAKAVGRYPIHGLLMALRYLMDESANHLSSAKDAVHDAKNLIDRQMRCLRTIWQSVKPLLCNDAPEGFVPNDLSSSPAMTTKDILSYAWRALRESSLLLRTLILRVVDRLCRDDLEVKSHYLECAGNLCFTQLAELRHRGAFSTVAQTFAAVCHACTLTQDVEIRNLVYQWYQKSFGLIEEKSTVITRRSAGIPALIVGILASEPKSPSKDELIGDLCRIATRRTPLPSAQESELPQVHALNSLAAIFSNSAVGENCDKQIVAVLEVASNCLGSRTWAIRNCGLILFRSLVDRFLGSNESLDNSLGSESSHASRLSYDRYPGLIELVQRLLNSSKNTLETLNIVSSPENNRAMQLEAVFAVLGLLRRAPPPQSHLTSIRQFILVINNSPYWLVRDLAARAFSASLGSDEFSCIIRDLLQSLSSEQNEMHGRLLCIKYAVHGLTADYLVRFADDPKSVLNVKQDHDIIYLILSNCETFLAAGNSQIIKSECLRLINTLGHYILQILRFDCDGLNIERIVEVFRLVSMNLQTSIGNAGDIGRDRRICQFLSLLVAVEAAEIEFEEFREMAYSSSLLFLFEDHECCQYVLGSLMATLRTVHSRTRRLFAELLAFSLQSTNEINIVRVGEWALLEICEVLPHQELLLAKHLFRYLSNLEIEKRFLSSLAPRRARHDITIWGLSLHKKWERDVSVSPGTVKEAESWIGLIQYCLDSDDDFTLRYAAIKSMRWFAPILSLFSDLPGTLQVQCALALYDGLNDDDEDLRALAAEISSFLLGNPLEQATLSEPLTPPAAANVILEKLVLTCRKEPWIAGNCINRLLQRNSKTFSRPLSVLARLEEIAQEETLLFVVEKQNLYRDEIKEAKVWSRVLQSLSPLNASHHDICRLTDWTMNGLDTLITYAAIENDGPLGWTSKPDSFALGMRVILAAETLLVWRTMSNRVPVQASTILTKLQELSCAAHAADFHEMWLSTIATVLRNSITMRLKRLLVALNVVPLEAR